jgi:hypothetical protein
LFCWRSWTVDRSSSNGSELLVWGNVFGRPARPMVILFSRNHTIRFQLATVIEGFRHLYMRLQSCAHLLIIRIMVEEALAVCLDVVVFSE